MGTAPSSSLIPTSDTVSSITNIITSAASTIANIASSNSGDVLSSSSSSFSDSDRIFELSAATLYSLAYVQVRTACHSVHFFKYNN